MPEIQRTSDYPLPAVRRLRAYAFDPQASVELSTAVINDAVIELPWETRWEDPLEIGPVNDYLEVIDHDPASGVFYQPLDLNDPVLLAQNGLSPSEGRPQFHQQMVFAVAMRTIRSFERALGRPVLWAGDHSPEALAAGLDQVEIAFTRRLRIYPHALREANAYYSPEKRALLFGYFQPGSEARTVDANWVFTCLSQDIVGHETTHAIVHGLQQRSIESSNVDALAFHEGFADLVALLQHFAPSDVLHHQLAMSRGSLRAPGLLTGLAQQFGRATGRNGALRYALELLQVSAAKTDSAPVGAARPSASVEPADPPQLATTTEPHARGGFLVAAVFDAFVTIYERRTADLFRIARLMPGGRDPYGDLPSDLVARMASEASKAADHVLRICVRALDYIPPVDLTFGEYLRAVITADTDLVPNDPMRYRVAFVEAFRKWKIIVPGVLSMAPDSLLWAPPDMADYQPFSDKNGGGPDAISSVFADLLKQLQLSVGFDGSARGGVGFDSKRFAWSSGQPRTDRRSRNLRDLAMKTVLFNQQIIHDWFDQDSEYDEGWERLVGMRLLAQNHRFRSKDVAAMSSITMKTDKASGEPAATPLFEVNSARISRRAGPNGEELHQLIIQMTQRRRAYFDPKEQDAADAGHVEVIGQVRWDSPDFWFRGGATIHVDLRDGRLLRIIRKRIDNAARLAQERAFRTGDDSNVAGAMVNPSEPFAFLHRSGQ